MQMPSLARQFGQEVFKAKLEQLFLSSLTDSVQQVREATIKNLGDIAKNFGTEWAAGHLLPKIEEQYTPTSGYSSRLTILHAMTQLCGVMTPEQIVQLVVPTLVKGTKDTVPNVRFCACIQLQELTEKHNLGANAIENVIKPALRQLLDDTDCEVQYFASAALAKCK
jgi:serine/threonine-protein phosphatase 2A regulatory subunit A